MVFLKKMPDLHSQGVLKCPLTASRGSCVNEVGWRKAKQRLVSRTKFLLKKHHEDLKNCQITAHLSSHPVNQINLADNMLRRRICFRTPRKLKEFVNVSKWRILSHSKAETGTRKILIERFEILFGKLGFRKALSSLYHPVRSSWLDGDSKSEKRVDLTQFRTLFDVTCCQCEI